MLRTSFLLTSKISLETGRKKSASFINFAFFKLQKYPISSHHYCVQCKNQRLRTSSLAYISS